MVDLNIYGVFHVKPASVGPFRKPVELRDLNVGSLITLRLEWQPVQEPQNYFYGRYLRRYLGIY